MTNEQRRMQWIAARQAEAHKAVAEAETKTPAQLAFDLHCIADDLADQAGDMTCHDDASPFLQSEAACRRAATILRALDNPATTPTA